MLLNDQWDKFLNLNKVIFEAGSFYFFFQVLSFLFYMVLFARILNMLIIRILSMLVLLAKHFMPSFQPPQ